MKGVLLPTAFLAVTVTAFAADGTAPVKTDGLTAPQKSAWNLRDHVPLEKVIVQSHRGAGVLAEEGTIEAFELGWKLGTYPESDLRATKDGVIVSFHDENFARVVKDASPELKKKGVKDLTYAEVAQLDVGSWKGEQF